MSDLRLPNPEESDSRRVLRGFIAMSASSFGVMAIQVGYAAITSRLLTPSAFGAYAVALSGVGLIGMVGGSSLGQSAARRDHDSVQLDRSLVTLSLLVGCTTALVAIVVAPLWGRVWGAPDSVLVTQVLALSIPVKALSEVLAGILRRGGRTSAVAGRTAIGQLTGLLIGLAVILGTGTAWSLGVAPVAGAMVSAALLAASLPRERLMPARPTAASVEDTMYGAKSAGMNLLRYSTYTIPAWSISRFSGAAALGAYNRATSLLTVPLEALQRSFTYSVFPELRPNGPMASKGRALTDVMVLLTWPALFAASIGYFFAPPAVAVLLGPGWEAAESVAGVALLLGVVPIWSAPLGSALEALGLFRSASAAWATGAVCIVVGATLTATSGSLLPAMLGLLIAKMAQGAVFAFALARAGRLSIGQWGRGSWAMVALQAMVTALLWVLSQMITSDVLLLASLSMIALAELALLWAFRERTTFGRIALAYSLPGFGRS